MKFAFSENFRGHGCLVEGQVSLGDILLFADLFPLATDKILRHGKRKIFLFLTDIGNIFCIQLSYWSMYRCQDSFPNPSERRSLRSGQLFCPGSIPCWRCPRSRRSVTSLAGGWTAARRPPPPLSAMEQKKQQKQAGLATLVRVRQAIIKLSRKLVCRRRLIRTCSHGNGN